MRIILFLLTILISNYCFAQTAIDEAWDAYRAKDYNKVVKMCKILADNNDDEAMCLLYFAYNKMGDTESGLPYLIKAAEHDYPRATYTLGLKYQNGDGIPMDITKAEYWYQKCIHSKSTHFTVNYARVNMAIIYYESNRKDYAKSLLEEAMRTDKEIAPRLMAEYFYKEKDPQRAVGLYRIAAENGDDRAQFEMGNYFEEGKVVEKDYGEAAKWYLLAAEQGNWWAQDRLGACYEKKYRKTLDERDLRQCLKWYYIPIANKTIIHLGTMENIKVTEDNGWIVDNAEAASPLERFYREGVLGADKYSSYSEWEKDVVAKLAKDSDVDVDIPKSGTINKDIYALIITNENYEYEQFVPYAENDGKSFKNYCQQTIGIPEKNIHFVTNASLNKIKHEIDWLIQIASTQNAKQVIFYFSGHGVPAEDLQTSYLLPTDGYAKRANTGYDLSELYQELNKLNMFSIVFLDACFSGEKKKGGILVESKGVAVKAKSISPQGRTITFSACQGIESAGVYEEQKHGLFTYYLLKKLQDSKGDCSLGELSNYLTSNVVRQSVIINAKSQTPSIMASPVLGDSWKNLKLK